MKYQIVTSNDDMKLEFTPCDSQVINNFCRSRRDEKNSQCEEFYKQQFLSFNSNTRTFNRCPYGLCSVGPIKWTERTRIASGFLLEGKVPHGLPENVEINTEKQVDDYLRSFDHIASEFFQQNYEYLESAIHDVRHLNAEVTAHAESLLKGLGYAEYADWDKEKLYSSDVDKRTLSIYCASRDISAALSIHEIAIDPQRAKDDVVPTNIHKLFYRQKQINLEKLEKKKLSVQIENTSVSKKLTRSFALIPIILLNNAIKYAENNSTISINFIETGSTFRIICNNSGPIVRNDELDIVFLKGRRGSNKSGIPGHGIGLWLASLILHANLGTISMATQEGGRDYVGRRTGITSVTVRLT